MHKKPVLGDRFFYALDSVFSVVLLLEAVPEDVKYLAIPPNGVISARPYTSFNTYRNLGHQPLVGRVLITL
jgi:hypothetical protein